MQSHVHLLPRPNAGTHTLADRFTNKIPDADTNTCADDGRADACTNATPYHVVRESPKMYQRVDKMRNQRQLLRCAKWKRLGAGASRLAPPI